LARLSFAPGLMRSTKNAPGPDSSDSGAFIGR
jgi:hypothetical protein